MGNIIEKLKEGDLRQKGRSEEVVAEVIRNPGLFKGVIDGMMHEDPGVRMRASDAAEKITRKHPEYLRPHKDLLLGTISRITQQEVRWHLAQMLPPLNLDKKERKQVVNLLFSYLTDKSSIVKTFAMQGLADIAEADESYLSRILGLIEDLAISGTPAMRNRGRKLLAHLKKK